MYLTENLVDAVVEYGYGSNLPPGATGQHVSRNYVWFRVDGGAWRESNFRAMHAAMSALRRADTLAEFLDQERAAS